MNVLRTWIRHTALLAMVAAAALLAGCERPPVNTVQWGPRGTGMEQVYNPRTLAAQEAATVIPAAQPPAPSDGPRAKDVYQNVKVLGDLSVAEFARTMVAITAWVSPDKGCAYCHNAQNFADDGLYTKVVARRMVQMTQHINSDWKNHVGTTGVTCYSCHRGNPVPKEVWFKPLERAQNLRLTGGDAGQNRPTPAVNLSSLPYDPYTPYLLKSEEIKIYSTTALPVKTAAGANANPADIKKAEGTYALMVHMAQSLGVNCTFCHNTQAFASWATSPPQRGTAWYGIRMARDLNNAYMEPLTATFPKERLGPTGDVAKVNCATCHQGAYKPLYGEKMLEAHPELAGAVKAQMAAVVSDAAQKQAAAAPAEAKK